MESGKPEPSVCVVSTGFVAGRTLFGRNLCCRCTLLGPFDRLGDWVVAYTYLASILQDATTCQKQGFLSSGALGVTLASAT